MSSPSGAVSTLIGLFSFAGPALAFGKRRGNFTADDEGTRRLGAVEPHDSNGWLRRAVQVGNEREDRAKQDRHLETDRDGGNERSGRDPEVLPTDALKPAPSCGVEQ